MSGDSRETEGPAAARALGRPAWERLLLRVLTRLSMRRWWRTKVPRPVRLLANRVFNRLMLARQLELELAKPWEEQIRLVVPAGERVELPVLWVVELYSPSHFRSLEGALASRSWPRDLAGGYVQGRELMERMRRTRERGNGFTGVLGRFFDVDAAAFPGFDVRREELPDGIEWIEVHAFVLTPAITAVVATCRLYDAVGERLNTALMADYRPRLKYEDGRAVLATARSEGISAVQQVRASVREGARKWLAQKIPGIFAAEGDGQLPLMDLLLTRKHRPIEDERSRDAYITALGLSSPMWGRTVSPQLPGFKLDTYEAYGSRRGVNGLWMLAANYTSAFSDEAIADETEQERSARSIGNLADAGAQALLVRLAISEMIELKSGQMNRSRDLAEGLHSGSRPVASLKKLRKNVLANSVDLTAIADGLASLVNDEGRYEAEVPKLWSEPSPAQDRDEASFDERTDKDVLGRMARSQLAAVKKLVDDDSSLTQLLVVAASLTGSISGIRMQRWAMTLSIISLVVAAAAAVFAYLALKP